MFGLLISFENFSRLKSLIFEDFFESNLLHKIHKSSQARICAPLLNLVLLSRKAVEITTC